MPARSAQDGAELRLAGLEGALNGQALGDVVKRHHAADHDAVAVEGLGAVLGGEAGAVGAEHDLVVDVGALALVVSPVDQALLDRIRVAIGARVVHEIVHALPQQVVVGREAE
jgi:hypothetical protein